MPKLFTGRFAIAALVFSVSLFVALPFAFSIHGEGAMNRYLVTGTYIDPGVLMERERSTELWENAIAPSLKVLSDWEEEGRIKGGTMVGDREGTFIIDAPSNDKLDQMLQSLPFWPFLEWSIVPLTPFDQRLKRGNTAYEAMKEQAN